MAGRDDRQGAGFMPDVQALLNAGAIAAAQQQLAATSSGAAGGGGAGAGGMATGKQQVGGGYFGPPNRPITPVFSNDLNGLLSKQHQKGNAWGGPGTKQAPINPLTIPNNKWIDYTADRPVILWSLGYPTANPTYNNGLIYYAPDPAQLGDVTSPTAAFLNNLQVSIGSGIIYLPGNTKYWIYQNTGADLAFVVIDATDPLVAARYLSEQGNQGLKRTTGTAANTAGAAVQAWPADRYRKSVVFSNQSSSVAIRLYPGQITGAANANFLRIPANSGPFILSGQEAQRAGAYVFADDGALTANFFTLEIF